MAEFQTKNQSPLRSLPLQRLALKPDSLPFRLHEVTDVLMVCAVRVFEYIVAVISTEAMQCLLWGQILYTGERKDLARTVVLSGFAAQVAVAEGGRGEVIQGIDHGDGVGEGDVVRSVVQALQKAAQFHLVSDHV